MKSTRPTPPSADLFGRKTINIGSCKQRASERGVRGHPFITLAKFSGFWTPFPPCSLFWLNHMAKFSQPRLLHSLLGTLPPPPLCERNKRIAP